MDLLSAFLAIDYSLRNQLLTSEGHVLGCFQLFLNTRVRNSWFGVTFLRHRNCDLGGSRNFFSSGQFFATTEAVDSFVGFRTDQSTLVVVDESGSLLC